MDNSKKELRAGLGICVLRIRKYVYYFLYLFICISYRGILSPRNDGMRNDGITRPFTLQLSSIYIKIQHDKSRKWERSIQFSKSMFLYFFVFCYSMLIYRFADRFRDPSADAISPSKCTYPPPDK